MNRIAIYDLHPYHLETFIKDLETTEIRFLIGGISWGSYPNFGLTPNLTPNIYISTIYDGVNTISNTYEGAGSYHDNKINTIDYSRTTNAWIYT
ncbi:hypothetical protein H6F32_00910 [Anabaena sp. FACHB-1237]|uniref:hypothetical protein n=1 Tax=Anabaena sp. FACHB-1237 TaxID=2692769 RepID=UPI0016810396|nr:hypothetical protein [Anabaena sp. FACHB-1237]MBD2136171.1 hypothetical protein [Anabaena sp. FACHB-1237]